MEPGLDFSMGCSWKLLGCAQRGIEPLNYAAPGATALANGSVLVGGLTRKIITTKLQLTTRLVWSRSGSPG